MGSDLARLVVQHSCADRNSDEAMAQALVKASVTAAARYVMWLKFGCERSANDSCGRPLTQLPYQCFPAGALAGVVAGGTSMTTLVDVWANRCPWLTPAGNV